MNDHPIIGHLLPIVEESIAAACSNRCVQSLQAVLFWGAYRRLNQNTLSATKHQNDKSFALRNDFVGSYSKTYREQGAFLSIQVIAHTKPIFADFLVQSKKLNSRGSKF